MDWSNERYVRVYTRDTPTWVRLGWEGQSLLLLLLRKLDRVGSMDGITDPVCDLSLMTGMPEKYTSIGLERLSRLGIVEMRDATLFIPNFVAAQECSKSDAQRQRDSRERHRTAILAKTVTKCYNPSQNVTFCHAMSQPVTDVTTCHDLSLRSRADPVPIPCRSLALPIIGGTVTQCDNQSQIVTEVEKTTTAHKCAATQRKKSPKEKTDGSLVWDEYAKAYGDKYGVAPVRNSKNNSICCELVRRLGVDEAQKVAAYYPSIKNAYHVSRGHTLACFLADCEKIRTEWATGRQILVSESREDDRLEKERASWERVREDVTLED